VEQFCKMDWEGRVLTPEGEIETDKFLVSPRRRYPGQQIVVAASYQVTGRRRQDRDAHFDVEYQTWGTIDSSLRFAREEGRIPDKPILDREFYDLVFTNRHNEFRGDRINEVVQGPFSWRIQITPSRRHVSMDAAIRYVTDARDRSNHPLIKENAGKTLTALQQLVVAAHQPRSPNLRKTPVEVVEQFVEMDLDGKQLSPDGRKEMGTFLVQPGPQHWETIEIMKEIGVGHALIHDENRAEVGTLSFRWGELDPRTALLKIDAMPDVKILGSYDLVLGDQYGQLGSDGGGATESTGSLEWRISGPIWGPQISVDTATCYVADLRDKTTDPVIKRNAAKTLAELKHLH
jgi:hypothetical protein